jgi:glycolate oxidase FAD binding subunit
MSAVSPEREQLFARLKTRLESLRELFGAGSNYARYRAPFDEYLEQREFGLALESLCEFLMEPDVRPVSDPEMGEIASLHAVMGVADQCVSKLKKKRVEQAKQLGLVEEATGSIKRKAEPIFTAVAATTTPAAPPSPISSSLRYKFIAILGPDHVHAAGPSDQLASLHPKLVLVPGSESELAEVLRLANEVGLVVIPRGGATKLDWGNAPSRADLILSTAHLNRVLEHASSDLTVTVEAGCTIESLQQTLAQHGQRLAIDPLWPDKATVGGILSTNDSGALRLRFGALRDLIIGVTIALPDGTLASSGGRVVKNVAGYDLPKLVTGAFGTLGVITRAVFRLHPLPHHSRSLSISTAQPKETEKCVLAIQNSKLAHTFLQSHFSDETSPVSDILFEGTEAGLAAQESQLRNLVAPASVSEASSPAWTAREGLWNFHDPQTTAIAKISILPANLASTIQRIDVSVRVHHLRWRTLIYATGIGWLRLVCQAPASGDTVERSRTALVQLRGALQLLRTELENQGGSLVVLHAPEKMPAFDAWGDAGDALPLMKSVKHRLDPKNTLNPGRFVGGI